MPQPIPSEPADWTPGANAIAGALLTILFATAGIAAAAVRLMDALTDHTPHLSAMPVLHRMNHLIRDPAVAVSMSAMIVAVSFLMHALLIRLLAGPQITMRHACAGAFAIHAFLLVPLPMMLVGARSLHPMIAGPTGDGLQELTLFLFLGISLYALCALVILPRLGALAPARIGRCPVRNVLLRTAMVLILMMLMLPAWLAG